MKINLLTDRLSWLLFPQDCPFCGSSMRFSGLCCEDCADKLPHLTDVETLSEQLQTSTLDGITAVFRYEGLARNAVLRFKNENHPEAARILALWMAVAVKRSGFSADCIVPIPSHKHRVRIRGFSPPALLAKHLGQSLQLPIESKLLTLTRKTAQQHTLSYEERMHNLSGAYLASASVCGKRILLCDDIVTTGATFREAAAALKAAGADAVYAAALDAVGLKNDGYCADRD